MKTLCWFGRNACMVAAMPFLLIGAALLFVYYEGWEGIETELVLLWRDTIKPKLFPNSSHK